MYYHKKPIDSGVKGEISKVREEYQELDDAYENSTACHTIIESLDVIMAVSQFTWKKYKIPLLILVPLALTKCTFNVLIRNPVLNLLRVKKKSFFISQIE